MCAVHCIGIHPAECTVVHVSLRSELAQAQVEQGKMLLAEDDLKKREEKVLQEKRETAKYRETQEKKYAQNAVKQREASQR